MFSKLKINILQYNLSSGIADYKLKNGISQNVDPNEYLKSLMARNKKLLEFSKDIDVLLLQEAKWLKKSDIFDGQKDINNKQYIEWLLDHPNGELMIDLSKTFVLVHNSSKFPNCVVALNMTSFDIYVNLSNDPMIEYARVITRHKTSGKVFQFLSCHLSGYQMDAIELIGHQGPHDICETGDYQARMIMRNLKNTKFDYDDIQDPICTFIGVDANSSEDVYPYRTQIFKRENYQVLTSDIHTAEYNKSNMNKRWIDYILFNFNDNTTLPGCKVKILTHTDLNTNWNWFSSDENCSDHFPIVCQFSWLDKTTKVEGYALNIINVNLGSTFEQYQRRIDVTPTIDKNDFIKAELYRNQKICQNAPLFDIIIFHLCEYSESDKNYNLFKKLEESSFKIIKCKDGDCVVAINLAYFKIEQNYDFILARHLSSQKLFIINSIFLHAYKKYYQSYEELTSITNIPNYEQLVSIIGISTNPLSISDINNVIQTLKNNGLSTFTTIKPTVEKSWSEEALSVVNPKYNKITHKHKSIYCDHFILNYPDSKVKNYHRIDFNVCEDLHEQLNWNFLNYNENPSLHNPIAGVLTFHESTLLGKIRSFFN